MSPKNLIKLIYDIRLESKSLEDTISDLNTFYDVQYRQSDKNNNIYFLYLNRKKSNAGRKRKPTPAPKELYEEHLYGNMSLSQLAKKYNVSRSTIIKRLKEHQIAMQHDVNIELLPK